MFSEEGKKSLLKEVLKEDIFDGMTYKQWLDNIDLIKEYLEELKAEYAFRVHMENGLESYDELNDMIKRYVKNYSRVISYKEILEKKGISNNLNVKDLNENEEYTEKYFLKIPKKTIIVPKEKSKTR